MSVSPQSDSASRITLDGTFARKSSGEGWSSVRTDVHTEDPYSDTSPHQPQKRGRDASHSRAPSVVSTATLEFQLKLLDFDGVAESRHLFCGLEEKVTQIVAAKAGLADCSVHVELARSRRESLSFDAHLRATVAVKVSIPCPDHCRAEAVVQRLGHDRLGFVQGLESVVSGIPGIESVIQGSSGVGVCQVKITLRRQVSGKPATETKNQVQSTPGQGPVRLSYGGTARLLTNRFASLDPKVKTVVPRTSVLTNFAISPDLPPHLSLDRATGKITGRPERAYSQRHEITADVIDQGLRSYSVVTELELKVCEGGLTDTCEAAGDSEPLSRELDSERTARSVVPPRTDPADGRIASTPLSIAALRIDGSFAQECGPRTGPVERGVPTTQTLRYETLPSALAFGKSFCHEAELRSNFTTAQGAKVSFFVDPPLPPGLHIDEHQGSLRGTPALETPLTEYLVCAEVGDEPVRISCRISFAVVRPPGKLTYPATETVIDVSVQEASRPDMLPSLRTASTTTGLTAPRGRPAVDRSLALALLQQGAADRFLIEPGLPAGLTFNHQTGDIRGTPTIDENRTYRLVHTVTAENRMGMTTCKVHLDISWGAWNLVIVHVSSGGERNQLPTRWNSSIKRGFQPLRVAGADAVGCAGFDAKAPTTFLSRGHRFEKESGMKELTAMLLGNQSYRGVCRHGSSRFPVCVPG